MTSLSAIHDNYYHIKTDQTVKSIGWLPTQLFLLSHVSPDAAQVNKTAQPAAPPNIIVPFVRPFTHLQAETGGNLSRAHTHSAKMRERRAETMLCDAPKPAASV